MTGGISSLYLSSVSTFIPATPTAARSSFCVKDSSAVTALSLDVRDFICDGF